MPTGRRMLEGFVLAAVLAVVVAVAAWGPPGAQAPSDDAGIVVAPGETAAAAAAPGRGPHLAGSSTPPGEARPSQDAADAPAAGAAAPAGAVLAVGIAVDAERRPVAGAEVSGWLAGREAGRARTQTDGSFELLLPPPPGPEPVRGAVALQHAGRAAWRPIAVGPGADARMDLGRIVLSDTSTLRVIVRRAGVPVAGAEVALADPVQRQAGLSVPSVRTADAGEARFEGVLGPQVTVFAVAPGTGRAMREVRLPAVEAVALDLPDDRRLTVKVTHGVTGAPVEGAEVSVGGSGAMPLPSGPGCLPPLAPLRTDASGRVEVSGLPPGWLTVVARAPGLALRSEGLRPERVSVPDGGTEAAVLLWPYRALRFPLAEGGERPPAEATALSVHRYQPLVGYDVGQVKGRIEDGHLVLAPFPPGHDRGHVEAPGGLWAPWTAPFDRDLGEPVAFRRAHDLRVRLEGPDGAPVAGELLRLVLQPRGRRAPQSTGPDGETVFERCVGDSATVLWLPAPDAAGLPLGGASLQSEPGLLSLRLERPLEIVLRLRVAGAPALPPGLEVLVPEVTPDLAGELRRVHGGLREDPAQGEVAFRWVAQPGGEAPPVTLRAAGLPAVVVVPRRDALGVWRGEADLRAGAALRVRVEPPEGGRYGLRLERWAEGRGSWEDLVGQPAYEAGRRGEDGLHVFAGLDPGRYRLVEWYSGLLSEPRELRAGESVDVAFPLGAVVVVRGRLAVPPGESPAYAMVHAPERGTGALSRSNPARVRADGTYEFRALRGERLTLRVEHPLLRAAGPPLVVEGGVEPPVLTLVPAPHVVFRLAGSDLTTADPDPSSSPAWWSPVHVRARRAGAWEEQGPTSATVAQQGRFRAGVPSAGRWDLRVEQHGFVPIVLTGVEVGDGPADLGVLSFSEGATLSVRLLPGPRGLPADPIVQVRVLPAAAPGVRDGAAAYTAYGAQVEPGEPPTVRVGGLAAGRLEVRVLLAGVAGEPAGEASVECDGRSPLTVDLRLR